MRKSYTKKGKKKKKPSKKWENKKVFITNKALGGKIDTALEKRMKKIAEDEVKEVLNPLVYRRFINWNGTQNPSFTLDPSVMTNPEVDFDGQVFEMTQIPLRKTTAGTLQQDIQASGFRSTDTIKIHGITVGIRCVWDQFQQGQNAGYEKNHLHIGVFKWRSPLNMVEASQQIPGPINENANVQVDGINSEPHRNILLFDQRPTASKLLELYPWGYSSRLDNPSFSIPGMGTGGAIPLPENEFMKTGPYMNKKKLFRTKLSNTFKSGSDQPNVQQITKYIKLDKPMTIKYSFTQANGARIQSPDKLFLVLRSQIRPRAGDNPATKYYPKVFGFYKLHYYDV